MLKHKFLLLALLAILSINKPALSNLTSRMNVGLDPERKPDQSGYGYEAAVAAAAAAAAKREETETEAAAAAEARRFQDSNELSEGLRGRMSPGLDEESYPQDPRERIVQEYIARQDQQAAAKREETETEAAAAAEARRFQDSNELSQGSRDSWDKSFDGGTSAALRNSWDVDGNFLMEHYRGIYHNARPPEEQLTDPARQAQQARQAEEAQQDQEGRRTPARPATAERPAASARPVRR